MAEKPKSNGEKHSHHSGGEMPFGLEVILFLIVVFIIWLLAGGAKKTATDQKPFMAPLTDQVNPGTINGTNGQKN